MSQMVTLNKTDLIDFEQDIAVLFNAGEIRAPIHLVGGNEETLINIFEDIKPEDWVFSTHRSHYHALLKGVPPELVKAEILAGRSICLNFPEYNFYSSAIVGGSLPQAVGVAMTIHMGDRWKDYDLTDCPRVWVFCGDMACQTGMFYECVRYSDKNRLPIRFVVEDNGLSVLTPTLEVWPKMFLTSNRIITYKYKNTYGHQGTGEYIVF